MDTIQIRTAIISYLEGALEFADQIGDASTAYLIERALDEARSRQFSGLAHVEELH
jgi:hypothetical protein